LAPPKGDCGGFGLEGLDICVPSSVSWISDIVFSILRLRVLGLDDVVPKLACLACPRRAAVGGGPLNGGAVPGVRGVDGVAGDVAPDKPLLGVPERGVPGKLPIWS